MVHGCVDNARRGSYPKTLPDRNQRQADKKNVAIRDTRQASRVRLRPNPSVAAAIYVSDDSRIRKKPTPQVGYCVPENMADDQRITSPSSICHGNRKTAPETKDKTPQNHLMPKPVRVPKKPTAASGCATGPNQRKPSDIMWRNSAIVHMEASALGHVNNGARNI